MFNKTIITHVAPPTPAPSGDAAVVVVITLFILGASFGGAVLAAIGGFFSWLGYVVVMLIKVLGGLSALMIGGVIAIKWRQGDIPGTQPFRRKLQAHYLLEVDVPDDRRPVAAINRPAQRAIAHPVTRQRELTR